MTIPSSLIGKTKVIVLGAGGIVGQYMTLTKPDHVEAMFVRRETTEDGPWTALDLLNPECFKTIEAFEPDVIINLAGENRVDVVEQDPEATFGINVGFPFLLAVWCQNNKVKLIQCSTQGVFSGDNPPYSPTDIPDPITAYGRQKYEAERYALHCDYGYVARLTFVIGIRPFDLGRRNPLEDIVEQSNQLQVDDRFFSPLNAEDAAYVLWELVDHPSAPRIVHIGEPIRVSRYTLAADTVWHGHGMINAKISPVSHEYFPGIAPRPIDTTWAYGSLYKKRLEVALLDGMIAMKGKNGSYNKSKGNS